MAEAGFPDVNVSLWSGFFVPAGTPKAIVDKIHKELNAVITQTEVKDKLRGMAVRPTGTGTDGVHARSSPMNRRCGPT